MAIKTKAGTLSPDKRYNLTLRHGASERELRNASVREFEQSERVYDDEGIAVKKTTETRYEATGQLQNRRPRANAAFDEWEPYEEDATVGFILKDVTEAEEV